MAFEITERARLAAEKIVKEPNVVLCIDGIDTCYGSSVIIELIRIGDPNLFIDGSWVIGGFREIEDQLTALSLSGSTTSIKQQLDLDKGRGSSIPSMEIGLVDLDGEISSTISPGVVVEDVLGRKAKVKLGFGVNTSFPEDFITIHRGIIDDIQAQQGIIKLNIAHPDQKKRQQIFSTIEHALDGAINSSQTTITLDSTSEIFERVLGPDGAYDPAFESCVRIDDEIIKFTSISGFQLTGCTRGYLGTLATSHNDETSVKTFYILEENALDLALKLMLSGWQGPFVEDYDVTHFNIIGDASVVSNSIFFSGVDLLDEFGLVIGDYITTTGASNGANNVTLKQIDDIIIDDFGTYLVIADVSFVNESDSAAVIDFRSQYDTLPSGCMMSGDEVDIEEHLKLRRRFLSSFEMRFYIKDSIENAKEFIELELYKPAGAYSLPRKARASLGFFTGPIPGSNMIVLDKDNIINPQSLNTRRSTNKNFQNTIVYKYEDAVLEDKFLRGVITRSGTSPDRIPVGTKALVVESKGLREDLLGTNNAQIISNRKLRRFEFGAEYINGIDVLFGDSFNLEIGDIVIIDGEDLNLLNSEDGTRIKPQQMYEVANKELNIINGKIRVDVVDTGFDGSKRYGLISPSSRIKTGISMTKFVIEQYFRSDFGGSEYRKWSRYPNCRVKVRSADFTTHFAQSFIQSINGNEITLGTSLGFIPDPGDIMELSDYDFAGVTEQIKLTYSHMTPLTGGDDDYVML